MGATLVRVLIGLLLAVFFVPLFAMAGALGGCVLMLIVPNAPGAMQGSLMVGAVIICALVGIGLAIMIARGIHVGERQGPYRQ